MRDPDPAEIDRVLEAGGGAIRMVTLAPERDGALAAIGRIVDAGVVAAVGHTEATYEQTRAAIDGGRDGGHAPVQRDAPDQHREPGPVIALLEDPRVTVELITDGVHVDPALYRHVCRSVGARPGVVDHRRDGRGRDGRRRLPARAAGGRRRRRGGPGGRHGHHRGQHRDDGPPVPVRRRTTAGCPATRR